MTPTDPISSMFPKVDFSEDKFIADIDRIYTRLGRCVIMMSPRASATRPTTKSLFSLSES